MKRRKGLTGGKEEESMNRRKECRGDKGEEKEGLKRERMKRRV